MDERVRQLERRWRETGNPDDEARYLRAASQAGLVGRPALERAFHLGHEPAAEALGRAVEGAEWDAWVAGFAEWGQEACVRVGVAFAHATIPWRPYDRFDGPDDRFWGVLDAVEAWTLAPSKATAAALEERLPLLEQAAESNWQATEFADALRSTCRMALEGSLYQLHLRAALPPPWRTDERHARRVIPRLLIPWLLGRDDPLRALHAGRGRWVAHHTGLVRHVLPLADDAAVVVTSAGRVERWRLAPAELLEAYPASRYDLYAAAATPDGTRLALGDLHGRLTLVGQGPLGTEEQERARGSVRALSFLADGERLLVAGDDGTVELWDRDRPVRVFAGHQRSVGALAATADGARFVSGGRDGAVRLWDVETGHELAGWGRDGCGVEDLKLLPDGERGVVAWDDRRLELRAVRDGTLLGTFEGHEGSIRGLAVSADGERVAGVADTVCAWEVERGELLRRWTPTGVHLSIAFTPAGELLTGARNGGLYRYAL